MNTMVKGLRYKEQGTTAWNNNLKQLAKVALHLGEPSVRLDSLPTAVYILACERILMARKEHGIYSA